MIKASRIESWYWKIALAEKTIFYLMIFVMSCPSKHSKQRNIQNISTDRGVTKRNSSVESDRMRAMSGFENVVNIGITIHIPHSVNCLFLFASRAQNFLFAANFSRIVDFNCVGFLARYENILHTMHIINHWRLLPFLRVSFDSLSALCNVVHRHSPCNIWVIRKRNGQKKHRKMM